MLPPLHIGSIWHVGLQWWCWSWCYGCCLVGVFELCCLSVVLIVLQAQLRDMKPKAEIEASLSTVQHELQEVQQQVEHWSSKYVQLEEAILGLQCVQGCCRSARSKANSADHQVAQCLQVSAAKGDEICSPPCPRK